MMDKQTDRPTDNCGKNNIGAGGRGKGGHNFIKTGHGQKNLPNYNPCLSLSYYLEHCLYFKRILSRSNAKNDITSKVSKN